MLCMSDKTEYLACSDISAGEGCWKRVQSLRLSGSQKQGAEESELCSGRKARKRRKMAWERNFFPLVVLPPAWVNQDRCCWPYCRQLLLRVLLQVCGPPPPRRGASGWTTPPDVWALRPLRAWRSCAWPRDGVGPGVCKGRPRARVRLPHFGKGSAGVRAESPGDSGILGLPAAGLRPSDYIAAAAFQVHPRVLACAERGEQAGAEGLPGEAVWAVWARTAGGQGLQTL